MPEEKKSYILLKHTMPENLEKAVNEKIKAGYSPYGDLHVTEGGIFYQAMTLNTLATQKISITGGLGAVGPISGSISVS